MGYFFSRAALFVVSVGAWAGVVFGGWILFRGVVLYEWDPALMGTGGGISLGGLLVVALSVGGRAQIATARDVATMRALMELGGRADHPPGPNRTSPSLRADPPMAKPPR